MSVNNLFLLLLVCFSFRIEIFICLLNIFLRILFYNCIPMVFNNSIYIFYEMAVLEASLHLFMLFSYLQSNFFCFCDIFKVPLSQSLLLNIFHYFVIIFFSTSCFILLIHMNSFFYSSFTCLRLFVKVPWFFVS